MERRILVGGGLVGSLLATYFGQQGFPVDVYEGRSDPRKENLYQGRSFNLVLSQRGIVALQKAGIEGKIMEKTTRLPGRIIHTTDGKQVYQPYGVEDNECLHAVSRESLNKVLLDVAESSGDVRFHFGNRCEDYDLSKGDLVLRDLQGHRKVVEAGRVFGTDGAASAVRDKLTQLTGKNFTKETACFAYKELIIPSRNGTYAMEPHAFHVWPRGRYVMTAQTNKDGSFSGALFMHREGEDSFETVNSENVQVFFESNFPDLVGLMPNLARDFERNPVGGLCSVKCPTWTFEDKIALLGDAAHAMVPFYGQGTNCGFEDVVSLDKALRKNPNDVARAFREFELDRRDNAYAITDLSLQNMKEMSDGLTDPRRLLAKQVAHSLAKEFPNEIIATHAMVTSHPEISYQKAKRRGEILDELTFDIVSGVDCVEKVDLADARRKVVEVYGGEGLLI